MNYELCESNWKSIFKVDMKNEKNKIFSELSLKWIKKYLNLWKRVAILLNKTWYSNWIICNDCWNIPKCLNCDIPIWFHKNDNNEIFWFCNICKNFYKIDYVCTKCKWQNVNLYWVWTQQICEFIKNEFWYNSLEIKSWNSNSFKKIQELKSKINNFQIIVWTWLISWYIKNFDFELLIFQNADIWLNIPDFNVNFNNFLFMYDCIIKNKCKNIIIQTRSNQYPTIQFVEKFDLKNFIKNEINFRKLYKYPPFCQICVISYKNELEKTLFSKIEKLYNEILYLKETIWDKNIEIYSTPPMIYKMFWKYRFNIVIKWENIRSFIDKIFVKLKIFQKWFKIDWNPNSII